MTTQLSAEGSGALGKRKLSDEQACRENNLPQNGEPKKPKITKVETFRGSLQATLAFGDRGLTLLSPAQPDAQQLKTREAAVEPVEVKNPSQALFDEDPTNDDATNHDPTKDDATEYNHASRSIMTTLVFKRDTQIDPSKKVENLSANATNSEENLEETCSRLSISTDGSKSVEDESFNPLLLGLDDWAWYTTSGSKKSFNKERSLFSLLTSTWEKLECLKNTGAGSKKKATLILANYFSLLLQHCPQEILLAAFLTLHRVAPDYCGIEIGLGESLLTRTICETYGRKESQVKQSLQEIGDLGSIALQSRIRMSTLSTPGRLSLHSVFFDFTSIAKAKGASAQTKKREIVKKLLVSATEFEPKFIIRFLEKQLRIGVQLQTVLTAIAWAFCFRPVQKRSHEEIDEDTKLKRDILDQGVTNDFLVKFSQVQCIKKKPPSPEKLLAMESAVKQAYSQTPNMGYVLYWLLSGVNPSTLCEKCVICPGVPVAPMLAKPTKGLGEIIDTLEGLTFRGEYKYDGERIQIHKLEDGDVHLFSRNMEVLDQKYPDVKEIALSGANDGSIDFILDAEVVAIDTATGDILPFQILSTRKRKDVDAKTVTIAVAIFVFDCLRCNGEVLLTTSLRRRQERAREAVHEIPNKLLFARGGNVSDVQGIETLLNEALDAKTEGLMIKVLDGERSYYEPSKRSVNWLKLKKDYLDSMGDSVDLVPIGAFWGRGKRSGAFGAYLLAVYDCDDEVYRTVCKVATGFSAEDLGTHHKFFEDKVLSVQPNYYHVASELTPDVWLQPAQVWECKAADLSISPVHTAAFDRKVSGKGIALRFPRYLRVRFDKKVEDATASHQILEMYEMQFAEKGAREIEEEQEAE